jgi:hypothetical protein
MPRSGTTLTEQILGSHPLVHPAGERSELGHIMSILQKISKDEFPNNIKSLRDIVFKDAGGKYIKMMNKYSGDFPFCTNKMPGNFLLIGLIKIILPNAKVIHCHRDPMDNCYSVYKQFFLAAHKYAYHLQEIGKYYLNYHKLMEHWNSVLPGFIHNVKYEDMVANQEDETRKLLHFCSLEFSDSCLHFYKNKRRVFTASATQVRKPIYSDSILKWNKYKNELEPLYKVLLPILE